MQQLEAAADRFPIPARASPAPEAAQPPHLVLEALLYKPDGAGRLHGVPCGTGDETKGGWLVQPGRGSYADASHGRRRQHASCRPGRSSRRRCWASPWQRRPAARQGPAALAALLPCLLLGPRRHSKSPHSRTSRSPPHRPQQLLRAAAPGRPAARRQLTISPMRMQSLGRLQPPCCSLQHPRSRRHHASLAGCSGPRPSRPAAAGRQGKQLSCLRQLRRALCQKRHRQPSLLCSPRRRRLLPFQCSPRRRRLLPQVRQWQLLRLPAPAPPAWPSRRLLPRAPRAASSACLRCCRAPCLAWRSWG